MASAIMSNTELEEIQERQRIREMEEKKRKEVEERRIKHEKEIERLLKVTEELVDPRHTRSFFDEAVCSNSVVLAECVIDIFDSCLFEETTAVVAGAMEEERKRAAVLLNLEREREALRLIAFSEAYANAVDILDGRKVDYFQKPARGVTLYKGCTIHNADLELHTEHCLMVNQPNLGQGKVGYEQEGKIRRTVIRSKFRGKSPFPLERDVEAEKKKESIITEQFDLTLGPAVARNAEFKSEFKILTPLVVDIDRTLSPKRGDESSSDRGTEGGSTTTPNGRPVVFRCYIDENENVHIENEPPVLAPGSFAV